MSRHRRRARKLRPLFLLTVAFFAGLVALAGWLIWDLTQPRFMDLMIELGQPMPEISRFATENVDKERVELVSDLSEIKLDQVGVYSVTLRIGNRQETVTLTVRDTTPPAVQAQDLAVGPGAAVTAEDFLLSVQDLSETEVSFLTPPPTDADTQLAVQILVRDASGNETVVDCMFYRTWMKLFYTLEVGQILTAEDLLLDPAVDPSVLDPAALSHISWHGVGSYEIGADWGEESLICAVKVVDTTAPTLELQPLTLYGDQTAVVEDFILSLTDASGTATAKLLTTLTFGQIGSVQEVTVEAADASGNVTTAQTTLTILEDKAPQITGLTDIVLSKYMIPDYTAGVAAVDDKDGEITFQVDDSMVQLQKAGTYFVTYTAVDSAGNKTSLKRRVVVENSVTDTDLLVADMAAKCGNDPKSITDFVRNMIRYNSSDWGGDDPVYSGFTKGSGNCNVSARCLLALLEFKGYNAQLIWVKEEFEPHYWVIVEIEPGVWRHVDATRGVHARHSFPMTDAQRLETLFYSPTGVQRYWDTEKWPACV